MAGGVTRAKRRIISGVRDDVGLCDTVERIHQARMTEQRASRQTHVLAWAFLEDIYRANEAGNMAARADLMLQLALMTNAHWYLEREGVGV